MLPTHDTKYVTHKSDETSKILEGREKVGYFLWNEANGNRS